MKQKRKIKWQVEAIAIWLTLAWGVVTFLFLEKDATSQDVCFDNEISYLISDGWTAETGGVSRKVDLPATVDARAGETVTFRRKLEKQETFCNVVLFQSYHQLVRVFLEEKEIYHYGQQNVTSVHKSPGSAWQMVRLPADFDGKELKIELTAVYDSDAGMISNVWIGTKSSLVFRVAHQVKLPLLLNLPIMVMGTLLVICSFFYHDKQSVRKIRSLGLFCLAVSAWILTESRVSQFFLGDMLAAQDVLFLIFDAIPVFTIYFLNSYQEFRESRWMKVLMAAAVVNYLVTQVLNLAGVESYVEGLWRVHALIILVLAEFCYIYVDYKRKKLQPEDKTVFVAAFFLCYFGMLDILNFYLDLQKKDTVFFTRIGLICFVILLGISVLHRENSKRLENVEKEVLEKLAYTDMMTGLSNRTAFEKEMQRYRDGKEMEQLFVLVADLNGLKIINDRFGHSAGDQAIIKMGELLRTCFDSVGSCYRIGGDEFCVIARRGGSKSLFEQKVLAFEERLKQTRVAENIYLCAACGWEKGTEAGIDAAFREADEKMYVQKAKMHSEGIKYGGSDQLSV